MICHGQVYPEERRDDMTKMSLVLLLFDFTCEIISYTAEQLKFVAKMFKIFVFIFQSILEERRLGGVGVQRPVIIVGYHFT